MGKVIFSSPGCFAGNSARRAWTLKFFRAQPLKISSDFFLRGSKSVQDLCTSWHSYPPKKFCRMAIIIVRDLKQGVNPELKMWQAAVPSCSHGVAEGRVRTP